jgi:hypothetical protein
MRPKLQKQSVLKLAGRIIPEAKRSGMLGAVDRARIPVREAQ